MTNHQSIYRQKTRPNWPLLLYIMLLAGLLVLWLICRTFGGRV